MQIKLQKGEKKPEISSGHAAGQQPLVYSQQTVIILSVLYTTINAEQSDSIKTLLCTYMYILHYAYFILFHQDNTGEERRGPK